MEHVFKKGQNYASLKNELLLDIIFCFFSIIIVFQNTAFLFNPFILILFCAAIYLSFSTYCVTAITCIITSLFINKKYCLELAIIASLFLALIILKYLLKYNNKLMLNLLGNGTIFLIYFFSSNSEFSRLNSSISFIFSIICCYQIALLIDTIKKKRYSPISFGFLFGLVACLSIKIEGIGLLWATLVLIYFLRVQKEKEFYFSLLLVYLLFVLLGSYEKTVLLIWVGSLFIASLLDSKYNVLILILVYSILSYSIDKLFYLDQIYFQVIGAASVGFFIPKELIDVFNRLFEEEKTDYDYKEKVHRLNKVLSLLTDNRFEKYEDIKTKLAESIRFDACQKCKNKNKCELSIEKYIKSNISSEDKQDISHSCYYPERILKGINYANKRLLEYSDKEVQILENKESMTGALGVMDKVLNGSVEKAETVINYEIQSANIKSGNELKSGDQFLFKKVGGCDFLILCDGMGHTSKSQEIASYLIDLMNNLIDIMDVNDAIEYANKIILAKTYEELYSTIDIAKINLSNCEMELFKGGSFSTFIIRNKKVLVISSHYPPLGIVKNVVIAPEKVQLQCGDILIFMTDGFGENVYEEIEKTSQKAVFLPLSSYVKFLYRYFSSKTNVDDDKTIIGIKINKI